VSSSRLFVFSVMVGFPFFLLCFALSAWERRIKTSTNEANSYDQNAHADANADANILEMLRDIRIGK
jgi:hypothetical protein